MPRIPRTEATVQVSLANQPTMDPGALTGPGRALQGLGRSIASLGGAFEGINEEQEKEQLYGDQLTMYKADTEIGLAETQAQATYDGDGSDYYPSRQAFYENKVNETLGQISPKNQQRAQIFFEQRRGPLLEGSMRFGQARRVDHLQTQVQGVIENEVSGLAKAPPQEFDKRAMGAIAGINATINGAYINGKPLSPDIKDKLSRSAAELMSRSLLGLAADENAAPEIIPKIRSFIANPEAFGILGGAAPGAAQGQAPMPGQAGSPAGEGPADPSGFRPDLRSNLGGPEIIPNLTAYSPQKGGSEMEGGYAAARPGPDGKAEVRTLADVAAGRSQYVTIAGDKSLFGKSYTIPEISFVDKDGKTQTLTNVKAVVHDTGSAFKGAKEGRYDIAIDRDASDKQIQASHGMWKQAGLRFVPEGAQGAMPAANPDRSLLRAEAEEKVQTGGSAFEVAKAFIGAREDRDARALSKFFEKTSGQKLNPAQTAWCAAFVNATLAVNGTEGTGSLMARSFLDFGTPTKQPTKGDIVVLSRGNPNGSLGHVGFYSGRDKDGNILVLGGNQGNTVSVKAYSADRVLGFRVPPKAGEQIPGMQVARMPLGGPGSASDRGVQVADAEGRIPQSALPQQYRSENTIPGATQVADASGNVPGWRPVDAHLREMLTKQLPQLERLERQILSRAEATEKAEQDALETDVRKQATDLWVEGKLTREWVQSHREILPASTYEQLMEKVVPAVRVTDHVVLSDLMERADEEPDVVLDEAEKAFASRRLTRDDVILVRQKVERFTTPDTRQPQWVREYRSQMKRLIRPSAQDRDPETMRRYGETLERFDRFWEDQLQTGKTTDRKSLADFSDRIIKEHRTGLVEDRRRDLSVPKFSQVGRDAMTVEEIDVSIQRTVEALKAGKITREEAQSEAALLRAWRRVLESDAAANGKTLKPSAAPAARPAAPGQPPKPAESEAAKPEAKPANPNPRAPAPRSSPPDEGEDEGQVYEPPGKMFLGGPKPQAQAPASKSFRFVRDKNNTIIGIVDDPNIEATVT